jgi:hypothetical protein
LINQGAAERVFAFGIGKLSEKIEDR